VTTAGDEPLEVVDGSQPNPDASVITDERAEQVNTVMNEKLSTEQRVAIRLFHCEGWNIKAIAKLLGKKEDATKTLIQRARATLADLLLTYGFTDE
jgi:RNA polymerase sigma factor (sigma-70 family)